VAEQVPLSSEADAAMQEPWHWLVSVQERPTSAVFRMQLRPQGSQGMPAKPQVPPATRQASSVAGGTDLTACIGEQEAAIAVKKSRAATRIAIST
jgi:hypothetical protein